MAGKKIWQKNLQDDYGAFGMNWGYASSPLLYDGKLILQVLHGQKTDAASFVVALDAVTGKENWRQERPTDAIAESPDAYTTPTLLQHDGETHIVILGGDYVTGHDPGRDRRRGRHVRHRPSLPARTGNAVPMTKPGSDRRIRRGTAVPFSSIGPQATRRKQRVTRPPQPLCVRR